MSTRSSLLSPSRHRSVALGAAAALLAFGAASLQAQQRNGVIVGTVLDRGSQQPLDGAQISVTSAGGSSQVAGAALGALSDGRGHYILRGVRPGQVTVRAQRIGYRQETQTVTVPAGDSAHANFALEVSAVQLEAVVTTGTGGAVEKRELGAPIGVIDASRVPEIKPVDNIGAELEGQVSGVRSTSLGGGVGGASDLRIRGTSSFTLDQRPVVYIDGVRVDKRATDWTANLGNQACCNFNGGLGEDRLSDINPDDIDHIEILKGAAAATLYGSEATNGVIQIFTKKGKAESAPQWSFDLGGGFDRQRPNYPTTLYPNFVGPDGTRALDMNKTLIKSGPYQSYTAEVQGGANRATYFVSGAFSDENGSIQPNDQKKGNLRVNVNWQPNDKMSFDARTGFTRDYIDVLQSGNNWTALTGNASNGDPRNASRLRPYGEAWVSVADIEAMTSTNDANRFTGGLTMNYAPVPKWTNRFTVGSDQVNENKERFFPYSGNYGSAGVSNGEKDDLYRDYYVYTADYLSQISFKLPMNIGNDFSFGGQGYYESEGLSGAIGKNFAGPGVSTVSAATTTYGVQTFTHDVTVGGLVQDRFSFGDRLFTTVGLRIDGNSAFGVNYGYQKYPKWDVAYNLDGYSWMPKAVNSFKLRGAIGTAGKAPGPFDSFQTYAPASVFQATPALVPQAPGNLNLGPETSREIDGGFDAGFFGDRLGVEMSIYQQRTSNAIVPVALAPSNGWASGSAGVQSQNIGLIQNNGWDLSLNLLTYSNKTFDWRNEFKMDGLHNEVLSLGGLVGSVNDAGGNPITVGRPIGAVFAVRPLYFNTTKGSWVRDSVRSYYGPSLPTFNLSYSPSFRYKSFTLYALGTMERGAYFNNGDRPYRFRQHTGDEYLRLLGPGGVDTHAADSAYAYWGLFSDIEKRDNVRLRELSLSWDVPAYLSSRAALGRTTVTVAGHNIMWWDNCHCVDPNSNWAGASAFGTNSLFLSDAAPRQYRFTVRTHF